MVGIRSKRNLKRELCKGWQYGQVFKPKLRGCRSPIPIFVLHSPNLFYNNVHHRIANLHLQIILGGAPQPLSETIGTSDSSEPTDINIVAMIVIEVTRVVSNTNNHS